MKTILCYGDSNTYGYNPMTGLRYPKNVRWPGCLAQLLGPDYEVVEEGCNGRTTVFDDPIEGWKNGMDYLRACLNTHKPIDLIIMMLGSNDLKEVFHASAEDSAEGAGALVKVMQEFLAEKQGFVPKIVLVSPPEIGPGIARSPFRFSFSESAVARSKAFAPAFRKIAEKYGCIFVDAAAHISPSEEDSLHLMPEAHAKLAEVLAETVRKNLPRES
ncbi:MAG: SGNH/GDSL hydrolase family protein [Clostridium sp.]|nr:SGNH/GDSL hydrolase family protein [Clostridium sp.]MBO6149628.1 SGNH/GDSL hydrolase family protein [Clostridium sp.]